MNSSQKQIIVVCLGATLLGAAAGTLLHTQRKPEASPAQSSNATPPASALREGRRVNAALQESIRNGTGASRWLQLLATLENARPEDMAGLLRAAGDDSAMVRMLGARWAELDPDHMFRSIYADYALPEGSPAALPSRYTLVDVLFEQWTRTDVKAALKALTDVPDFSGRDNLRMTVCNRVMQVDVEEGLRVMKEWKIRNYTPDMRKVTEWAAKDPKHAAEMVLPLAGDYAATQALKQVGKAWAQSDPVSGLRFAADLPAGQRAALGAEIIQAWADRNLEAAIKFATEDADASLRATISGGLVSAWAKKDPAAALEWSQENLRGSQRAEAISSLIKAAAEKDLTAAAELVSGMQPGAAQNKACASIFETWFKKGKDQREAAFAWLAELPDGEAQKAALERVQWDWAFREPESVKEFLSGPHGKLASSSLVNQVARNQAAKNPEAAMEWARTLPEGQIDAAKRAVFDSWLSVRPRGAADFAAKMPSGPDRENAIRTVSQTLAYQSPKEAVEWYRTLPTADQQNARETFNSLGLPSDQRQALNDALKDL